MRKTKIKGFETLIYSHAIYPIVFHQSRSNLRGFTFFEMLMVVLLLGLFLVLVVPQLDHLHPRTRLNAAARMLAATVQTAKDHAILTSRNCGLRFDLNRGEYWFVVDPSDRSRPEVFIQKDENLLEPGREIFKRRRLPKGVQFQEIRAGSEAFFNSGLVALEINPLGVFSNLVFYLQNEEKTFITLRINGFTGQPEFYDRHEVFEYDTSSVIFE